MKGGQLLGDPIYWIYYKSIEHFRLILNVNSFLEKVFVYLILFQKKVCHFCIYFIIFHLLYKLIYFHVNFHFEQMIYKFYHEYLSQNERMSERSKLKEEIYLLNKNRIVAHFYDNLLYSLFTNNQLN